MEYELIPNDLFVDFCLKIDDVQFFNKFKYVIDKNNNLCKIFSIELRDLRHGPLLSIDKPDGRFLFNHRAFDQTGVFFGVVGNSNLIQRMKLKIEEKNIKINENLWLANLKINISRLNNLKSENFNPAIFITEKQEIKLFFEGIQEELKNGLIFNKNYSGGVFEKKDAILCLKWANINVNYDNLDGAWEVIKILQEFTSYYNVLRLVSARFAEKQVLNFYERFLPKDISFHQVSGESSLWKDFDIEVKNTYLDVKNARPSFSGNGSYIEHCVSDFKKNRNNGNYVSIVGVLSEYKNNINDLISLNFSCSILGEVNVNDARSLYSWMRKRFGDYIDLSGMWGKGVVPGWMFEYSDEYYSIRNIGIDHITLMLDRYCELNGDAIDFPPWVYLLDSRYRAPPESWSSLEKNIYDDLKNLQASINISRRSIYLYILCFSLCELANKRSISNFLTVVERFIKIKSDNFGGSSILFLIDPHDTGYIESLISLLLILNEEYFKKIEDSYVRFKMTHPLILKGFQKDGIERTVMAYCGGWRLIEPMVRCGKMPLVFGKNINCKTCGYLICDECGFCNNKCHESKMRQTNLAKTYYD